MSLLLNGVGVAREAGPVVADVGFEVPAGRVTAIVGPNGSGKTSLLEALSGVIPLSSGTISLDGRDLSRASRRRRFIDGLVHVEQGRAVFPSLTARENIALADSRPAALERAVAIFPEIERFANRPAHLLSGGEQQMVVLARSIVARPRYLLIDEMSLGLAPVIVQRLLPTVRLLADAGVGVVLVEQFTHLALGVADDAIVLSGGRVRWQGAATDLAGDETALRSAYLGEQPQRKENP